MPSDRTNRSAGVWNSGRTELDAELAALDGTDLATLQQRWESLYRMPSPHRLSRDLLVRGIAYRLQEKVHGGPPKNLRRRLRTLAAANDGKPASVRDSAPQLRPGTRLIREWGGKEHRITVLAEGFDYRGQHYGSLSEIARTITGARWSGPRFFGLNRNRPAAVDLVEEERSDGA